MFKPVSPNISLPKLEEDTIQYWKDNKIFEKSISSRPADKTWTFLDGPPFVTGLPHYGHLLTSIAKDLIARFWTMKGYRVRRVWGWDGHGLPIENKVENKLNIKRKKDIEEVVGVKKFIDECKQYVSQVSSEWEWYVDHVARWVDFEHAYRTWDTPYMESVMWVFKQLYEKNHIYKGFRVCLYCPHCETPISNFEVAMDADNYKDIEETGTTYKYQLKTQSSKLKTKDGEDKTFILAWSTTPWNKIVVPALAVNPKLIYVKVKQNNEYYILAKSTLKTLSSRAQTLTAPRNDKNIDYEIVEEFKGEDLVGLEYVPHYDYYKIEKGKKAFVIIPGDFVTADEGTGVVTIAAYGEEDLKASQQNNIHVEMHVDEEGMIKEDVPLFGGMYYLKANKAVNEDLQKRGLIYKDEPLTHSVPLCWRCHTRLYYAPIDAWFVNVLSIKNEMIATNEKVNWIPNHFKHGRFLKSLEHAPDWNISRNRYWGSPVPVWECKCGERFVPGSISELEERSGKKITELHKPEIDEVTVTCNKCGKTVHRVPEVLDSWIEAGSASFGERHYPFDKTEPLERFYPPDFIVEYTGQIRSWFHVLHVISNALYKVEAFKNVLVNGVILGTDGRKMSKNYSNYPDPKEMLQKYGGDALRLYLMKSPVVQGEDTAISEEQYKNEVKTLLMLWNVYNFFVANAIVDKWSPELDSGQARMTSKNVLDVWILARLNETIRLVTQSLEKYDTINAIKSVEQFISDLSLWYVRRSRDRVGPSAKNEQDKQACYKTFYEILVTMSKLLAPITPFIAEEMYRNLTGEESVHFAEWPIQDSRFKIQDSRLMEEMELVRKIVEMGHAERKNNNIKVRQPLQRLTYTTQEKLSVDLENLILAELNIKEIVYKKGELNVTLDTNITPALKSEGEARDIVRKIQEERKNMGTKLDEKVDVVMPSFPKEHEEDIKQRALVRNLKQGDQFSVTRI